jgi:hypothetical protein
MQLNIWQAFSSVSIVCKCCIGIGNMHTLNLNAFFSQMNHHQLVFVAGVGTTLAVVASFERHKGAQIFSLAAG